MNYLKLLLYVVAGAIVLMLVAAAALLALFDPNPYKPQIERAAENALHRMLKLQGDIKLAFYPSLGVSLGKATLSERASDRTFASIDSAQISVALLPLLRGSMVVDELRLAGLTANIVRHKDGSTNVDDLIGGGERPREQAAAEQAAPAKSAAPRQQVVLRISGIRIERSAFSYRDEASGQELELSDFSLRTGRIASDVPGALRIAASLKGRRPDLNARIELATDYRVNLESGALSLTAVDAKLSGDGAGVNGLASLKIAALQGSAKSVEASGIALRIDAHSGDLTAKGSLATALQANLSQQVFELRKLDGALELASPALAQKSITVPFNGDLRADLKKEDIAANLTAKLDDSQLRAKLGVAQFSPPRVSFDIDLDRIDLDRYLPAKADQGAPAATAKPGAETDTPVDLSALRGLDADGRLRIGALTVAKVKVSDIGIQAKLARGRLDVSPIAAKLYGGSLSGSLALDANGNRVATRQDLSGVQIGALVKDLTGRDALEGRGKVALDLSGAGASIGAIRKSLSGSARLTVQNGAVKGIDLADALARFKPGAKSESQAANRERKTAFAELGASFTVRNGVAHNEDLAIRTALFRIGGAGDIDVGASRLDYTARATVLKPSAGQAGGLAALAGVTVPVRVSGPFDAVKFDIDYAALARSVVKAKAGEKTEQLKGEAGAKAREAVKGKLRGLLRR